MPDKFQTLKKERCIEIIKACNGSGMPKRQWCREHGISYSTFMRWQRSLRNELAGKIMVTQAVVPLQIEPQASRCTPTQEVTISWTNFTPPARELLTAAFLVNDISLYTN